MIVIKYGGHALPNAVENLIEPDPMLREIARLHKEEKNLVLVHGGGPQINAELAFHKIESEMIGGYRKTSAEAFEIVQQVLAGKVLRTLVNQLIAAGANPVGLSSSDGAIIRARAMRTVIEGREESLGQVGDIDQVDSALLKTLLENGFLPVISPNGVSKSGVGLNLNADLVAGAVGGALSAEQVIFMTDVAGIYRNFPDPQSIITEISQEELAEMQNSFSAGMIPKVKAALYALTSGAKSVRIIDGREVANLKAAIAGVGGTLIKGHQGG